MDRTRRPMVPGSQDWRTAIPTRSEIHLTWYKSIRQSWIGIVALICFNVMLVASGHWILQYSDRLSERQNLSTVQEMAETQAQLLSRFTQNIDMVHGLASIRNRLVENHDDVGSRAIEEELRSLATNRESMILQVAIIDAQGYTAWSSVDPGSRVWLGDRTHFLVHQEGRVEPYVSEPIVGRVSGRWSLQFTRAILGPDREFAGVVVVSVDPFLLSSYLSHVRQDSDDIVVLYRTEDGAILTRSHDLEVALRTGRRIRSDIMATQLPGGHGSKLVLGAVTRRMRFLGYRTLDTWPLGVLVSMDAERMMGDVRKFNWAVGLVISAVSIASIVVLLWSIQSRRARQQEARLDVTEARLRTANTAKAEFDQLLRDVNTVIYTQAAPPALPRELRFYSPNASRILGIASGDAGSLDHLLHAEDRDVVTRMQSDLVRAGNAWAEYRLNRPDGRTIWVSDRARVVSEPGLGQPRIVGTIDDVTEWHTVIEKAAAESRLAVLGQMTSSLGHELSQPIAVIGLATENLIEMLEDGTADSQRLKTRLQRISRQVERAKDIMLHLRHFSHAGRSATAPMSVAEVIASSAVISTRALKDSGVDVHMEVPDDLPPIVGSRTLVEQVFLNLMSNACDAFEGRPAADRHLWIAARAEDNGRRVSISVRDNAGGIPDDALAKIFDFFYTSKPPGKGTGLGLPLAKNYMQSMGGDLVAGNVAGGAEFTMTLPAHETQPAVAAAAG